MEETGVLEKVNLSGFCYLALNQVSVAAIWLQRGGTEARAS